MSFFKKLFTGSEQSNPDSTSSSTGETNIISFGRYTDSNKSSFQLEEFTKAKNEFEAKNYLKSFQHFFEYVGDKNIGNVFCNVENEHLSFEIIQGSKIIKGCGDNEYLSAEAKVVAFEEKLSVAIMRRLMMLNYNLKYGMFAINEQEVVMKFKTSVLDASPNKLYAGLKEIATYADKQDDLLINEFSNLQSVDQQHVIAIPEHEKGVMFKYLHKWINETLERVEKLDESKYSGSISFALLSLAYKIDYLLTPEGILTSALEKVQSVYGRKDLDIVQRNYEMKKEFGKILEISKEDVYKSLYNVKATFGIVAPAHFKQVADFIFEESKKVISYQQNNELDTVKDIYEYIAGYCLFYWGMFKPLKELIAFYLHLRNTDYLTELGIDVNYVDTEGKINKNAVVDEIKEIVERSKNEYPKLYFNTNYLKFDSIIEFSASFFKEIEVLIFSK